MNGSEAYISKEQFYQIAHIRKDTARRLLASGLVPAVDTGKKRAAIGSGGKMWNST